MVLVVTFEIPHEEINPFGLQVFWAYNTSVNDRARREESIAGEYKATTTEDISARCVTDLATTPRAPSKTQSVLANI